MGSERGGILSLAAVLREHGDAVEADFDHYYRFRTIDEALSQLGLRRFWWRFRYLPSDAAVWRVQQSQEGEQPEPDVPRQEPHKPGKVRQAPPVKTNDPEKIKEFFAKWIG